jgi:hypothetical protein
MRSTLFGRTIFKEGIEEQGVVFFKCDAKDHLIDIIPYVAGSNDPNPKIKEGKFAFVLIIWRHTNIGVSKDDFICMNLTYKKPCPICEDRAEAIESGDVGRAKALKPIETCIYNIVCYDNDKELMKGVQIWAVAHWNFQRHLDKIANRPRAGGVIPYACPNNGKSIFFNREGTKLETTKYTGHTFDDRNYVISDEILAQAWSLDDLIHIPTYEEAYEAHYGESVKAKPAGAEQALESKVAGRRVLEAGKPPETQKSEAKEVAPELPPPTPPRPSVSGDPACPGKGVFGKDLDQLDGCRTCEIYDNCGRRNQQYEQERKDKLSTTAPRRRTLS